MGQSTSSVRAWAVLATVLMACQSAPPGNDAAPAPAPDSLCAPRCDGRLCGDDGCGGSCGSCGAGDSCTIAGQCETDCTQDCSAAGLSCGTHCGEVCGQCADGSHCDAGQCVCSPRCDGKVCGDDDGCGGRCEPCPRDVSCLDCALKLVVVAKEPASGERATAVTLAIDYAPSGDTPLPSLADLAVVFDSPADVLQVGIGAPVLEADKRLLPDATTGRPFQLVDESTARFVVMSPTSSLPIAPGRWVLMRVSLPAGQGDRPLVARLKPHEGMLAPAAADQALWSQPLDGPVIVWPTDVSVPAGGSRNAP